jgi:hypothetical protein
MAAQQATAGNLSEVMELLTRDGVAVRRAVDPHCLRFESMFGPEAPMFVRWVSGERLVQVAQNTLLQITQESRLAEVALQLLSINQRLDTLGFVLDSGPGPAHGAIAFRSHLFTDSTGRLDYALLRTLLMFCIKTVERTLPALQAIVGGAPIPPPPPSPEAARLADALRGFID